jgi:hypothetical protein
MKLKAVIQGTYEIPKNALHCKKMRCSGIMHEQTDLLNGEGNVRPCEGEIL